MKKALLMASALLLTSLEAFASPVVTFQAKHAISIGYPGPYGCVHDFSFEPTPVSIELNELSDGRLFGEASFPLEATLGDDIFAFAEVVYRVNVDPTDNSVTFLKKVFGEGRSRLVYDGKFKFSSLGEVHVPELEDTFQLTKYVDGCSSIVHTGMASL